jgi:holo-[acyl-carrier protein] synthase
MAVYSIGVDLIEIERIEKLFERYGNKFMKRIYSDHEIDYCSKKKDKGSYAARFAAKEAVFKATGLGLGKGMSWKDIEVVNDEKGKPDVRLYGRTAELLIDKKIYISLSHSKDAAIAMVVIDES